LRGRKAVSYGDLPRVLRFLLLLAHPQSLRAAGGSYPEPVQAPPQEPSSWLWVGDIKLAAVLHELLHRPQRGSGRGVGRSSSHTHCRGSGLTVLCLFPGRFARTYERHRDTGT
jgi:hypothetical protein